MHVELIVLNARRVFTILWNVAPELGVFGAFVFNEVHEQFLSMDDDDGGFPIIVHDDDWNFFGGYSKYRERWRELQVSSDIKSWIADRANRTHGFPIREQVCLTDFNISAGCVYNNRCERR